MSEYGERVHVSKHPIVAHKISFLRSSTTKPSVFRAVMRELTYHLGYEATSTLTTKPIQLSVPVPNKSGGVDHMEFQGEKVKEHVALIPILRSGLGMVDAMLELLPNAEIHHIGMYKAPGQNHPVQYFNRLPKKCRVDIAYVLDPCIATSSTIKSVIGILKKVSTVLYNIFPTYTVNYSRLNFHFAFSLILFSGVSKRFASSRSCRRPVD